jgi:predicted ATPase
MARRNKPIDLPAPYLKRVWLEPSRITFRAAYPSPMLMAYPGAQLLRLTKYGSGAGDREGDRSLQGHARVLR